MRELALEVEKKKKPLGIPKRIETPVVTPKPENVIERMASRPPEETVIEAAEVPKFDVETVGRKTSINYPKAAKDFKDALKKL